MRSNLRSGLWLPNRELIRPRNPLPAPFVARPRDARGYKPGSVFLGYGDGGGVTSLYDVIVDLGLTTNLKLCLDAVAPSYPGSGQTWSDLSGNAYDFYLGATSGSEANDPTYSAGPPPSFALDGGDKFTGAIANPTWVNNLHKDNAIGTVIVIYKPVNETTGGGHGLIGTATANSGVQGWLIQHNATTNKIEVYVARATTGAAFDVIPTQAVTPGDWTMVAWAINEATGANGASVIINTTAQAFTSTYSSPGTGSAANNLSIAARGGNDPPSNGAAMMAVACWEGTKLSDAQIGNIWSAFKTARGIA